MPIYEFKCKDCRKRFEIDRSVAQYVPAKVRCPKCSSRNVERYWGGIQVHTGKKS